MDIDASNCKMKGESDGWKQIGKSMTMKKRGKKERKKKIILFPNKYIMCK